MQNNRKDRFLDQQAAALSALHDLGEVDVNTAAPISLYIVRLHHMIQVLSDQRDELKNALKAIRDEFDLGCEKWCAANGLTPPAEFQVDGMARFVAQEALRRLESENEQARDSGDGSEG